MQGDVTIRLGAGILEVLALDDSENQEARGLCVKRLSASQIAVTTSLGGLRGLLDACRERQRPGWDQPRWYAASAGAAARRLETAIARVEARERP